MYIATKNMKRKRIQITIALAILLAGYLSLAVLYLAGCTDSLNGEVYANQKPIVYFANIPPEGQKTGRNLIVYWYGTDRDGLIGSYRYYVATVADVGSAAPEDYILAVPESEWTYIDVDPALSDPHTQNTIVLTADLNDPVNSFIAQWVFIQAFDMEGFGSDIVFRLYSRNDNPPETGILDFSTRIPFVDGDSGGIVTGVRLNWDGSDPIDYPREPPTLEFQWRLYGPYDSSTFARLVDSFVRPVYVGRDGRLYNLGDSVEFCDSLPSGTQCTTIVVTATTPASSYGKLEVKFFVDDPDFINDPALNLPVDSSFNGVDSWITNKTTTIYNVYRNYFTDTTVQMRFIFWIRSRDDAYVADLVPDFDNFPVISPRYERDVAVLDFAGSPIDNVVLPPLSTQRTVYWYNAIKRWNPNVVFDTSGVGSISGASPDYLDVPKARGVPLAMLLKHKVLILYDDNIFSNLFSGYQGNIYKAIDAGINVWLTMRASLNNGQGNGEPLWDFTPSFDYLWYFGVRKIVFSGWFCHAIGSAETGGCEPPMTCSHARIEDFMGAYALNPTWPAIDVDTSLLHTRYGWNYPDPAYQPCLKFMPEHTGLPEVDWSVRLPTTEGLYLYKSFYTDTIGSPGNHPLGGNYNMEGNPVAHRYNSGLFKTVHFNFTPLAIDSVQMQIVIDSVLNWLYEPIASPTSTIRYPDAPTKLSVSQERERYWRRCEERAKEQGTPMLH